ncbi:hypothetical protein VKT23_010720 [Stygiomarasmius scandens]|uniref:Uncharacterized protein n=1 Tax=Marasmiellus scandens TaxID=2682957 RepID=A0ABR1JEH2_9AGAR
MKQIELTLWYDHILARQRDQKPGVEFVLPHESVEIDEVDTVSGDEELEYDNAALQLVQEDDKPGPPFPLEQLLQGAIPFSDHLIDPELLPTSNTTQSPAKNEPTSQSQAPKGPEPAPYIPTSAFSPSRLPQDTLAQGPGCDIITVATNHLSQDSGHTSVEPPQQGFRGCVPDLRISTDAPHVILSKSAAATPLSSLLSSVSSSPERPESPVAPSVNGRHTRKPGRPQKHPVGSDLQQRKRERKRRVPESETTESSAVAKRSRPGPGQRVSRPCAKKNSGAISNDSDLEESKLIKLGFQYDDSGSRFVSLECYASESLLQALPKALKTPWKKMASAIAWTILDSRAQSSQGSSTLSPSQNLESDVPPLIVDWACEFNAFTSQRSSSPLIVNGELLQDDDHVLPVIEFVKRKSSLFAENKGIELDGTQFWLRFDGGLLHLLWAMSIWGCYLATLSPSPDPPFELTRCIQGITELGKTMTKKS